MNQHLDRPDQAVVHACFSLMDGMPSRACLDAVDFAIDTRTLARQYADQLVHARLSACGPMPGVRRGPWSGALRDDVIKRFEDLQVLQAYIQHYRAQQSDESVERLLSLLSDLIAQALAT